MTSSKPILLIDGDVIVYRVALRVEQSVCWGDDLWTLSADIGEARQRFDMEIQELEKKLKAGGMFICLSEKHTFRHAINEDYKANRRGKRKPTVFPKLRQHAIEAHGAQSWPMLEADDMLGILQTDMTKAGTESIIVTIDKDLKTIPGKHYNPDKPELGVFEVTPEEAKLWFYTQCIAGDPTDGYAGCPGLGVVRAKKLLLENGVRWMTIVDAYRSKGLDENTALENSRMARILHSSDWDEPTETVQLWDPPAQELDDLVWRDLCNWVAD